MTRCDSCGELTKFPRWLKGWLWILCPRCAAKRPADQFDPESA